MALMRNRQVLELSGLRLDQPLTNCGELNATETRLASEARFHAVQRAFQVAIDRRVDLVVLHSEILTDHSTGGRAPWFLARLIERCHSHGIPVVWAERKHNAWMERYVPTPANLMRAAPGDVHRLSTPSGPLLFVAGRFSNEITSEWRDETHTTIGLDWSLGTRHELHSCDLLLKERSSSTDRIEDFVASTIESSFHPLATLHTLRADRANSGEPLALSPLGFSRVSCSLSANVSASSLAEHLTEEIDAAAGRYFSNHPQTQLLIVDLSIAGHGKVWDSLWQSETREALAAEMNRLSRHPDCRVRAIAPVADGIEATRPCPFAPVVDAIWTESTDRPAHAVRSLVEIAPASLSLGDWAKNERVAVNHPLATEIRHACLHLLRSAS